MNQELRYSREGGNPVSVVPVTPEATSVGHRRFKPYPEYKDSGMEWLGPVPARWTVKRLKVCARSPIKNGVGEAAEFDEPTWPRYVRITDIAGPRALRDETFRSLPPHVARQAPLASGDLLLASVGATFGKCYLHRGDAPACYAGYLVRVSPSIVPEFLAYWAESTYYWAQVNSEVIQATIHNFSAARYRDLLVPVPGDESEQRAVVSFLDGETAKVDALIEKKERLIELLQEKRAALIARAVSRGLNPDVPFKDSGVEWLGQIPAHWGVLRSKWLLPERDLRSDSGEEELLTVSHITGVTPRSEKDVAMFEAETTEGYKLCEPGDLVINTLWAWMGAMGVSPVRGIVSPAYNVYTPTAELEAGYLDALVRIPVFATEVTRFSKGVWSSRLRLYPEGLYEICLPVPPVAEQREIIGWVRSESGRLDQLRSTAVRTCELLKEYRSALITAAVTGQIDVRDAG